MKRLLSIPTLLILFIIPMQAQVWSPVGQGLPLNFEWYNGVATHTFNGNIYVAYNDYTWPNSAKPTFVKRWDGNSWTHYPTIPDFVPTELIVTNSSIFVIGHRNWVIPAYAFYEFDGSNWIPRAPAGYGDQAKCATLFNGDLIIAGQMSTSPPIDHIIRWDGTSFHTYPAFPTSFSHVEDVEVFNGELYVLGAASSSAQVDGFYKWDGANWVQAATKYDGAPGSAPYLNSFENMFEYQNEFYICQESELYRLGNDTLHHVSSLINGSRSYVEYNGDMYIGDTLKINVFDGNTVSSIANSPSATALNVLGNELYAFTYINHSFNGVQYNRAYRTQANFSIIQGDVFWDANNDCFYNQSENPVSGAMIGLNNQTVTSSFHNGFYSIAVNPGTYSFSINIVPTLATKNFNVSCSLPNTISIGTNQTFQQNIAMSNPVPTDMVVSIDAYRGHRTRWGFTEWYKAQVINAGNSTMSNASVKIQVPPSLNFISSIPAPTSQNGNELTYSYFNMDPQDVESIIIKAQVDTGSNSLGDTIHWYAGFNPIINGDGDISDNKDTLWQEVVGAYDPNDKHTSHEIIFPGTTSIDYHINFQNTGNDTAYKVTLVDTLDLSIPMSSVMINSASHAYNLSVNNNVLIWEFDSILLPDSTTNKYGSMGYVNFSVNLSPNLVIGDTVKNQAHIFFDYQPAIKTNFAKTTLFNDISIAETNYLHALSIYPNPAANRIFMENLKSQSIDIELINSAGKKLDMIRLDPHQKMEYNFTGLNPGLYLLKSKNATYKLIIN